MGKRTLIGAGLAVAAALVAATGTAAAADPASFTLEATPLSQYVWRGLVLTNGPVLQTSSTVTYRDAHLNVFTNQDLNGVNGRAGEVDELDFDVGYDYARENTTLSAGAIRYTFPNTVTASTTELYAGGRWAGLLNPAVRGYLDVASVRGGYVTADVSHSVGLLKLAHDTTWDAVLAAGAGCGSANHNAAYYGVKRWALADLHPSVSLPLTRGKFRLTPRLGYGMLLDPALRAGRATKAHGFSGGISFALTI
jgi:hypothetical protein